ncbi:hypothetical protein P9B04_16380 [Crocosphaera sp. Alani8]
MLIITSKFSREATKYTTVINSKKILMDGAELCELLIDYKVGVSTVQSYAIKKIDDDYFTE